MAENARLSQRPQRTPNIVARTLAGEAVLLNLNTEEYFSLNEVGSRIWELTDGQRTVAGLVDVIVAEYDIGRADAEADVLDLLDELAGEGLVRWSGD